MSTIQDHSLMGDGPLTEWSCPLCPRVTGPATSTQVRAAGWRLRDDGSVVSCPYCWDNALTPEPDGRLLPAIGWDGRCHTCRKQASDGVRFPITRAEAQAWVDEHECIPDVWLIEPEEEK